MHAVISLLAVLASAERPVVPSTFDDKQATCIALSGEDGDALYLVPHSVCDSRTCTLRLELHTVHVADRRVDIEVLSEGYLTAGAALWTDEVKERVRTAASAFRHGCHTTPVRETLEAGAQRYTLREVSDTWYARSDNGRELPLSRLGDAKADPVVVDGHPAEERWAFARGADLDGSPVLWTIELARLAAPPFAELVASPRVAGEYLGCLGIDTDQPAMVIRSRRGLMRVTPRGARPAGDVAGLDVGCTDRDLDEPRYNGVPLIVGTSESGRAIELGVFEPRERFWRVGALRTVRGPEGDQREFITQAFWHPEVPIMVLRVGVPATKQERYVWVDLARRGIVKRAR